MHFPVYIHIGSLALPPHPLFESLAYFIGARLYFWNRRKFPQIPYDKGLRILAGAVLGAALGSKLLSWLENPPLLIQHAHNPAYWLGGETIVGGLLGGLIGVEIAKKIVGFRRSTGDAFVFPLVVGMCIGRVGCFLAGLPDHTYGTPTRLWTGVDFGDGIPRHPTQLYEIAFLLALTAGLLAIRQWQRTRRPAVPLPEGFYFQMFMAGYLAFRLLVEFIKPTPHIYFGFSNIQLACIAGLAYYIPKMSVAMLRARTRKTEVTHA